MSSPEQSCQMLERVFEGRQSKTFRYDDLDASAASGCKHCCLVRDSARMLMAMREEQPGEECSVNVDRLIGLQVRYYRNDRFQDAVELFTPNEKVSSLLSIPYGNTVLGGTGSLSSFQKATTWLQSCGNMHTSQCPPTQSITQLPNRVLYIGSSMQTKLKLRETRNERARYACLSHCWGGHQPLKTLQSNLHQHKRRIEWSQLPKTFQDTVVFTRRLLIQYLWIDSLCIIQDDAKDWEKESSVMADIYQNAFVTLAASAARGPHDGLFFEATPTYTQQQLISPTERNAYKGIFIRRPRPHHRGDHPLLSRAWFFQERILSPRVIHFGQNELLWECSEEEACECASNGVNSVTAKILKHNLHVGNLRSSPLARIANLWREMIQDYTQMNLTKPSDILPAISGVAKRLQPFIRSAYLAGIWQRWFVDDMLWTTDQALHVERPSTWRAPTFSWASVVMEKSHITWRYSRRMDRLRTFDSQRRPVDLGLFTYYSTLVEASCTAAGLDPTGQVKSGYAILSGPLIQGTIGMMGTSSHFEIRLPSLRKYCQDEDFFPDYNLSSPGKYYVSPRSSVFCVKLLSLIVPERRRQDLFFMVLRRKQTEEEVYERIGLLALGHPLDRPLETWFDEAQTRENAIVKIV